MWRATIKEGSIDFGSPALASGFQDWKRANEGKRVLIKLDNYERSVGQNALYWKYLEIVERDTGQLADDVHEWAKRKFLTPRFIKVNNEEIRIPGSTKLLDTVEFTDYLDKIASEIGVPLPDTSQI